MLPDFFLSIPEDIGSPYVYYLPALILFVIILVILTVAVALLICLLALLAAAGILSASAIIGLYHRSFKQGFKALIWMLSVGGGAALGMVLFMLWAHQYGQGTTTIETLAYGCIVGIIAGAICAKGILLISRLAINRIKKILARHHPIKASL